MSGFARIPEDSVSRAVAQIIVYALRILYPERGQWINQSDFSEIMLLPRGAVTDNFPATW